MDYKLILESNFNSDPSIDHLAFLGLYNADRYRDRIEKWLTNLDFSGTTLLVVDNSSDDETQIWMARLLSNLKVPLLFSENSSNLGGYGSLYSNLHFATNAKWITMLHQDDLYASNHLQNHKEILLNSPKGLGLICTEPISYSISNKRVSFPRGNWLVGDNAHALTVFLGHLRNHFYPFSGATILKEVLERFPLPIPSQAFPDTEIVMKMCPFYRATFSDFGTVSYLENPDSESHSLEQMQREIGVSEALSRVFLHESFKNLMSSSRVDDWGSLIKHLIEGISTRFSIEKFRLDIISKALSAISAAIENPQISSDGISKYNNALREDHSNSWIGSQKTSVFHARASKQAVPYALKVLIKSLIIFTPRKFRIALFRFGMRLRLSKKYFPQWDFPSDDSFTNKT
jgi:hypothetical protein